MNAFVKMIEIVVLIEVISLTNKRQSPMKSAHHALKFVEDMKMYCKSFFSFLN